MSTPSDAISQAVVRLPGVLDVEAAGALAGELLACGGRPLLIDASIVERMGALSLQVLLSARKTWAADGLAMAVSRSSEYFDDAVALFGAPPFAREAGDERAA